EAREGTYAELSNVQVTLLDTYGQFEVTDASGSAKVGDDAFYNYNPTLGDSLQTVRGVADYSYSERKLEPRDDADIIGPPLVTSMRYSPTPPTASSPVTFSCEITDNGTIARAKLFFSFDNGATYDSTDMVNTTGDSWEVAMGPYAAGTEVDYHVETTDNEGFLGRAPSIGDYDVYVGFLTIEAIQSTTIDGDSSSYEGSPVNVAGIVTAAPGTFADNTFYIQNNWVTDPSYRGIAVYSGGSLVGQLAVGDSVSLSGDVDEYYNFTQIRMHFTDAYTNHGPVGQLPAYQIATTDLPDSNVAVSEPWESVLVMAANSVVTNATAGYGQWYIDNTAPTTGTETMVDDFGPYTYQPVLGDSLSVRGVVQFSYGAFKVQPRSDSDILPFDLNDAVGVEIGSGPLAFQLSRIDPNPFTGSSAQIRFSIPHASTANLAVYDVTGRLVRTLVNGPVDAGHHVVDWDGSNQDHRAVSSGVYFYRLKADGQEATRKVTVLK
ncbi:MAG: T9SS type A sorting domain-containing protein, partial [Gemmatimonadota bacterium]|nr:T9SS type A sorting domain-containing protein [Gemmatimonadota bacterium]